MTMKYLLVFMLASIHHVQSLEGPEELYYMFQECEGKGRDYESALKDCNKNSQPELCEVQEAPICALGSFRKEDGSFEVLRGCMGWSEYNKYSVECQIKQSCTVVMCDEPRYRAELE